MKTQELAIENTGYKVYPQNIVSLMIQEIQENPIIKDYHGDLYHDIKWVEKELEEQKENNPKFKPFYWGIRKTGTTIGYDKNLVKDYSKICFIIFPQKENISIGKYTKINIEIIRV